MIDLLFTLTLAFLPPCGPATTDVFGCTSHEAHVSRSNFGVGDTGHYVEVRGHRITVHETYPLILAVKDLGADILE